MKNVSGLTLLVFLLIQMTACGGGGDGSGFGGVSLSARATSASVIELTWSKPGDGFSTSSYNIARVYDNSSQVIGNTAQRQYTVAGLQAETEYCYVIKVPLTGNTMSNTACATTLIDTSAPTTPTGLQASAISPVEVQLSWINASDNAGSVSYNVYRDGDFLISSARSEVTDNTAIAEARHCYRVSSYDDTNNESAQSAEACVTMPADTEFPTVPTELNVEYQGNTNPQQMLLDWFPATDDGVVRYYKIFRDGVYLASSETIRYEDRDLQSDTTYCYRISAVDAAEKESAQSEEVCAREGFSIQGLAADSVMHSKIILDRDDAPVVAYKQYTYDSAAGEIRIPLNLIRPTATTNPQPIQVESGRETLAFSDGYRIGFAIDDSNSIHLLHKVNHPIYGEAIDFIRADENSITTDTLQQTEDFLGNVALAIDSTGVTHGCYDLGSSLFYATNATGNWQATDLSTLVDITSGNRCDLAIDNNDNIHISFLENKDLKYATNSSGSWQVETVDLHSGEPVAISSVTAIATDPDGNAHIAYYHDYAQLALEYASNESGSWQATVLDSGEEIGDAGAGCDIAVDSNGNAHITYKDGSLETEYLKYTTNISGQWEAVILSGVGSSNTSIAIDTADKLHITFVRGDELTYMTNNN